MPRGGHLFPAFDLNHAYDDCDVFVSIGKMKEHLTAGITLSMKNCFGITPCTIYGDGAPDDEPASCRAADATRFTGASSRRTARRRSPKSAAQGGYRVPRCVADLVAARPIHLAIIDGISPRPAARAGGGLSPGGSLIQA